MQSDRQARIRERAYQIWVDEGRVHGKHVEHWRRAEHEVAEEEKGTAKPRISRRRTKAPVTSEAQPAEVSRSRAKAKPAIEPAKSRARSAPAAKAEAAKTASRGRRRSVDKPVS
jgi:Protein of unknown function (DUF2934)